MPRIVRRTSTCNRGFFPRRFLFCSWWCILAVMKWLPSSIFLSMYSLLIYFIKIGVKLLFYPSADVIFCWNMWCETLVSLLYRTFTIENVAVLLGIVEGLELLPLKETANQETYSLKSMKHYQPSQHFIGSHALTNGLAEVENNRFTARICMILSNKSIDLLVSFISILQVIVWILSFSAFYFWFRLCQKCPVMWYLSTFPCCLSRDVRDASLVIESIFVKSLLDVACFKMCDVLDACGLSPSIWEEIVVKYWFDWKVSFLVWYMYLSTWHEFSQQNWLFFFRMFYGNGLYLKVQVLYVVISTSS